MRRVSCSLTLSSTGCVLWFIFLSINTAYATVTQEKGAGLQYQPSPLRVFHYIYCQANITESRPSYALVPGARLYPRCSSWDLLDPRPPHSRRLISARNLPLPVWLKPFPISRKSWSDFLFEIFLFLIAWTWGWSISLINACFSGKFFKQFHMLLWKSFCSASLSPSCRHFASVFW